MKFEELHTSLLDMSEEERLKFMESYLERRARDLKETAIIKVKGSKSTATKTKAGDKKVTVTAKQLALLKQLGLV
jgi:hypothetical protein